MFGMFAPVAHADSFTIDDFLVPPGGQSVVVPGVGSSSNTATGLAGVVGGARTLELNVTTSNYGLNSRLTVTPDLPGTLSLSNDSGQVGEGKVTWDASGAGLGGVDITLGGAVSYLQSHVLFSDQDLGFRIDITETAAAGGSTAYWSTNLGLGPSTVFQSLSSFTNAGAVDFTKVDKIVLTLSGPAAQDGTIDLLEITDNPVPEPITLGGIALGVGALCGYIRRRMAFSRCGA
jgi:hypothetical protein